MNAPNIKIRRFRCMKNDSFPELLHIRVQKSVDDIGIFKPSGHASTLRFSSVQLISVHGHVNIGNLT